MDLFLSVQVWPPLALYLLYSIAGAMAAAAPTPTTPQLIPEVLDLEAEATLLLDDPAEKTALAKDMIVTVDVCVVVVELLCKLMWT